MIAPGAGVAGVCCWHDNSHGIVFAASVLRTVLGNLLIILHSIGDMTCINDVV